MGIKFKILIKDWYLENNVPATLAVNKFHNAISKNCCMLVYISAHNIVKLTLNKVLLLFKITYYQMWNETFVLVVASCQSIMIYSRSQLFIVMKSHLMLSHLFVI